MENVSRARHTLHWIPAEKRKRGRPRITRRDTLMKDISQMNATWDEICQTAMNRQEWIYGLPNVLVTGTTKVLR